ncbi:glycosyltransferase family 4 protein [Gillisia limnaea]|uniref:Glycosyl transferase group 1 n=1 Tax=Gillisia limnaea (strain DSM 15749 / LMG 21470 / R-8282) TaxID=865937 RepID=H2BV83_GILLR|nr:glycosyltransferase [Gillisia limnaea]EHQ01748.1 glycosyl transferase group 1 [Gillisia limnaea DSM 15749]
MKLLITAPFLLTVGGTEIETLITAQELANSGSFKKIEIFCPYHLELGNFQDLAVNPNIKFKTYPDFFNNLYIKKINVFFRRLFHLKTSFIENLFWFFQRLRGFDYIYILTSTTQNYYIPILNNFNPKNCLIKYTIVHEEGIESWKKKYLRALKWNIVMSKGHQFYIANILKSNNVIVQDIIIANEKRLLECQSNRIYTFGMLCRFSEEKRIEHAISLINKLKLSGLDATLIIQGDGDERYSYRLKELIKDYGLQEYITLIKKNISPANTHLFYKNISFFLITSQAETGPLTGLESMAAGVPVLSYNVGAMKERIGEHIHLVVNDFENMLRMAERLMNLSEIEYQNLSNSLRQTYISNCSNAPKISTLENLFFQH